MSKVQAHSVPFWILHEHAALLPYLILVVECHKAYRLAVLNLSKSVLLFPSLEERGVDHPIRQNAISCAIEAPKRLLSYLIRDYFSSRIMMDGIALINRALFISFLQPGSHSSQCLGSV